MKGEIPMTEMLKPLSGIKVLDLTLAGSGPSCTKLLAEFGAEVIWVEPLTGTSTRTVHKFDFYSTGKRSLCLNLKTDEGQEAISRIIKDSDVFVSNYRPKALVNLHLTYEEVKALKPDIIYATLTGFGEVGEEANNPGYDSVAFWSKGGMLSDIAEKGSLVVPPVAVGDITSGMGLFGGICASLYGRSQTGKGCHVYTSLLAQAIYLNHDALIETQYGEEYPKTRKKPRRSLLNTYKCKDGKWITLTLITHFEKYFDAFMNAIGLPELVGDPRWSCLEDTMYENAPELVEILDEAFSKMTQDEAVKALEAIDLPVSKVQSTKDLLTDPQVLANKYIYPLEATVPPEDGPEEIVVPASPIKIESEDHGVTGHKKGPKLGEHSVEILTEYGFSEEEIKDMLDKHIIK